MQQHGNELCGNMMNIALISCKIINHNQHSKVT